MRHDKEVEGWRESSHALTYSPYSFGNNLEHLN